MMKISGVIDTNVPRNTDGKLNTVDTDEIECNFCTGEDLYCIYEFCGQHEGRK